MGKETSARPLPSSGSSQKAPFQPPPIKIPLREACQSKHLRPQEGASAFIAPLLSSHPGKDPEPKKPQDLLRNVATSPKPPSPRLRNNVFTRLLRNSSGAGDSGGNFAEAAQAPGQARPRKAPGSRGAPEFGDPRRRCAPPTRRRREVERPRWRRRERNPADKGTRCGFFLLFLL